MRHPHSLLAAATDAGLDRQDLAYEDVSPASDAPGAQSGWTSGTPRARSSGLAASEVLSTSDSSTNRGS